VTGAAAAEKFYFLLIDSCVHQSGLFGPPDYVFGFFLADTTPHAAVNDKLGARPKLQTYVIRSPSIS
jgi:hypothetical protein